MKQAVFRVLFLSATLVGPVGAEPDKAEVPLRVALDLVDGSRVVGISDIESVPLRTPYANIALPLAVVATAQFDSRRETAVFSLSNGDRLQGVVTLEGLNLQTVFGKVSINIEHIRNLRVTAAGGRLPAGEGSLEFGGVNWTPWRTQFEVRGDKLMSLPKARAGFHYGHGGNGRGSILTSNVGSEEWSNYRVEFDFCMIGVNPDFNQYSLPLDYRTGIVKFHVVDAKESWNEPGMTLYRFRINGDGTWSLHAVYNEHCGVSSGFGNVRRDDRMLAQGRGLKVDSENGNRIRLDVVGTRIRIWVDDATIVDLEDEKMNEQIGGRSLGYGGVGFRWNYECMGWIRNFSARRL
jgi:hypothetical protein